MLKIIACEVMKEEILAASHGLDIEFEFVPMGFHLYPEKLRSELQSILDSSRGFQRIILAFGLCGGAARDLKASDYILTIPRVHDCIPIFLGSQERYEQLRLDEKGTFYLTCGWMYGEKLILSEYKRSFERFGEKKAVSIINRIYGSYKKILFISTSDSREVECLQRSHEIARLLNLKYHVISGDSTYIEKIIKGPWNEESFVNVPPYGTINEGEFIY